MRIRAYRHADEAAVLELTIATFRPFYEQSFPKMVHYERDLIDHQHGHWEQDYRDEVPTLHNPADGRHVAVAAAEDGQILGYVAWKPDLRPQHGEIDILAVEVGHRGAGIGSALMKHAMARMRSDGMRFVGLGTGGDAFHAPARHLYESLGFHAIPTVAYLRAL